MPLDDRADITGHQALFGNVRGEDDVSEWFEGHASPGMHCNEPRHVSEPRAAADAEPEFAAPWAVLIDQRAVTIVGAVGHSRSDKHPAQYGTRA